MCVPFACTCHLSIMTIELLFSFVSLLYTAAIQVAFSSVDYIVSEDAGNVVLALVANQPTSFDYTVEVDTVDGTAVGQLR